MPWVFKFRSITEIQNILNGEEEYVFELVQKRNFSGEEGDVVVLLVNKDMDWIFMYSCVIIEVSGRDKRDGEGNRYMIVTLGNFEVINQPNRLDDFSYTLTRITRFKDPIQHFRGKYASISSEEFNAIINGEIFISRTVFGKLINSLHAEHRLNFFKRLIDENPQLYFHPVQYIHAFQFLKSYLEDNLFQHLSWLSQTYEMLLDLVDEDVINQIGFIDPSDLEESRSWSHRVETISDQVLMIRKNQIFQDQQGLLIELESEILESRENEKTFNKLFRSRPLPIQFNF